MKTKEIAQLKTLAQLVLDRELAVLAQINAEEAAQREAIRTLDHALTQSDATTAGQTDLIPFLGAQAAHRQWLVEQRRKEMLKLSQIAARREEQVAKTQAAFGRNDVLDKLARQTR